jgi:hypothetical protein
MAKSPLAVVPIITLFIGGLFGPRSAAAQAIKLHKKTTANGEDWGLKRIPVGGQF